MVVHFSDTDWPQLQHSIDRLMLDMQVAIAGQRLTSTWTMLEVSQATNLLAELWLDWQTHRIRRQSLSALEQLSGRLDVAACTVIRANVEEVRRHLVYILQDAVTALNQDPAAS